MFCILKLSIKKSLGITFDDRTKPNLVENIIINECQNLRYTLILIMHKNYKLNLLETINNNYQLLWIECKILCYKSRYFEIVRGKVYKLKHNSFLFYNGIARNMVERIILKKYFSSYCRHIKNYYVYALNKKTKVNSAGYLLQYCTLKRKILKFNFNYIYRKSGGKKFKKFSNL